MSRRNPFAEFVVPTRILLLGCGSTYVWYLSYGNQNDLEPFVIILQSLAGLYYQQGKTRKEEKVYAELETRIPASRIRDTIHGTLPE